MNKHFFPAIFALFCIFPFFSCHEKEALTDEEQVQNVADSFSINYFTWHFDRAQRFSDDKMKHYLSFMASNVQKADLDLLLSTNSIPSIEVRDIRLNNNNSATATVDLTDVILMDTIGEAAHLTPKAQRTLTLQKGDKGEWKVSNME